MLNLKKLKCRKITPNIIIIGSQKSGTTSLHSILHEHSRIYMSSPVKEPGYFWDFKERQYYFSHRNFFRFRPVNSDDLIKNFMMKYYDWEEHIGESCPFYTMHFNKDKTTAEKIYNDSPDAKLIYIVRNPLDRIVSSYWHVYKRGNIEQIPEKEYMEKKGAGQFKASLYWEHLKAYLDYFKSDQIKVILFEDFMSNPGKVLEELASFLYIEKFQHIPDKHLNVSPKDFNFSAENIFHSLSDHQKERLENSVRKLGDYLNRDLMKFWQLDYFYEF